ncbi:50S ribosomal protein L1, chloroplastic-like [Hibiscus syriacus]|uniref:50S ribosomal protein L1, chloroplastic-like n=1 Tax=Hibiscus syriacus TaxID=106335 RepID=UPI001924DC99|nr:50S ribosomal protein L1, chloroplastic-like [Hibiscus syriacus]
MVGISLVTWISPIEEGLSGSGSVQNKWFNDRYTYSKPLFKSLLVSYFSSHPFLIIKGEFPLGNWLTFKVAVVTRGEKFDKAITAGADIVGGDDLIEQIQRGFREFDKLIASPDMMVKVVSLGKLLCLLFIMK